MFIVKGITVEVIDDRIIMTMQCLFDHIAVAGRDLFRLSRNGTPSVYISFKFSRLESIVAFRDVTVFLLIYRKVSVNVIHSKRYCPYLSIDHEVLASS